MAVPLWRRPTGAPGTTFAERHVGSGTRPKATRKSPNCHDVPRRQAHRGGPPSPAAHAIDPTLRCLGGDNARIEKVPDTFSSRARTDARCHRRRGSRAPAARAPRPPARGAPRPALRWSPRRSGRSATPTGLGSCSPSAAVKRSPTCIPHPARPTKAILGPAVSSQSPSRSAPAPGAQARSVVSTVPPRRPPLCLARFTAHKRIEATKADGPPHENRGVTR